MKTKHFLITTEDGSAVAVIGANCDTSFRAKLIKAIREQLCNESIVTSCPLIKMDYCDKSREIHIAGISYPFEKLFIQKAIVY